MFHRRQPSFSYISLKWCSSIKAVPISIGLLALFQLVMYILYFELTKNAWEKIKFNTTMYTIHRSKEHAIYFHYTSDPSRLSYPANEEHLSDNVTLVTAFFNIGTFEKYGTRSQDTYTNWCAKFKRVKSYVVLYSDDDQYIQVFKSFRKELMNRTRVIKVTRSDLWSFSLREQIAVVNSDPSVPKISPNTVVPDYGCIMHAKYDLVRMATQTNFFRTKYFAWIDQGYLREFSKDGQYFTLGLPPGFDNRTIAFNEVFSMYNMTLTEIFYLLHDWVGGGYFLGHHSILNKFVYQYRIYTEKYLALGLSSTDQEVLQAMYQEAMKLKKPLMPLQLYQGKGPGDPWFTLGKISILETHYSDLV